MSEQIKPLDAKTIGASTYRGRKAQTLLQAARHNLRDIQKELGAGSHIDASRICLNEVMAGPDTPTGVAKLAQTLMEGAGVDVSKMRKDYNQAHELLFTLSADTTVNTKDYFGRCLAWVGDQFGRDNILSAVVHLDEAAPHLHILLAPIEAGRYVGTSLIDRTRLKKLRALFADEVVPGFGLKVMQPLTGARRSQAIEMIHERLQTTQDAILHSALWETVKVDIARNPARYMERLGLTIAPLNDGGAEFQRIALSQGKGGKTERRAKPYGFETGVSDGVAKPYGFESDPENHRNPPCVGFTPKAPPASQLPAPATPPTEPWFDDDNQPLTSTPNADGEIAPPAHQALPDVDDTHDFDQLNEIALADTEAPFMGTTTRHRRRDDPGQDEPNVTRLHDDQDAGQWCAELGDFIRIEPSDRRVTPGTERHGAGRASRDRDDDQDNTADPDAFDQYNQPEVIDAWD